MTLNKDYNDPGLWIGLILIAILLIFTPMRCKAHEYDTIPCCKENIKKFAIKKTGKTTKIYAVYTDEKNNILDLIPVQKSAWDYICLCKENGITPSLAIVLKNGQIYSIIKYKPRYVKSKDKRPTM